MNIAICINGSKKSVYPARSIGAAGRSALDYVADYVSSIKETAAVYYLSKDGNPPEGYAWEGIGCGTMKDFLAFCASLDDSVDTILYIFGDTPLINTGVTREMLKNHKEYNAEYTFAEGFPLGFAPEIISRGGIIHMQNTLGDNDLPLERTSLFDLVSRDINTFDLETLVSKTDMRGYRISLGMENKEQFLRTCNILEACNEKSEDIDEDILTQVITGNEELHRTVPSYISVQLTNGCPQKCGYCPFPKMNPDLLTTRDSIPVERYAEVLDKIKGLSESGYINFSPFGEPSLHPSIEQIVKMTVESGFDVIIETSGLGWNMDTVRNLIDACGKKLTWIISLDANEKDLYTSLRSDGFEEAFSFAGTMVELSRETVYIQCVRMKENEDVLEPFYRFWKEKTPNIIIQKYDSYSLFLPENTVSDISPLKRNICWHIKRDMVILLDGSVPLCREDVKKEHLLGNIFKEDAQEIWDRGKDILEKHKEKKYPKICERCDEYYTYNF